MAKTPSSKFLDRGAMTRVLELADKVERTVSDAPYRSAIHGYEALQSIRDIVTADLPGGYIGLCKSCREIIAGDDEFFVGDGVFLCEFCAEDEALATDERLGEDAA